MYRAALVFVLLMLATGAQAQHLFSAGPPASATSPTADGRTHGAPASVVSPNPPPFVPGHGPFFSSAPRHPFGGSRGFGNGRGRGDGRGRDHRVFVPVPLFYPYYGTGFYGSSYDAFPSDADPNVAQNADPQSADPSSTGDNGANVTDDEQALRQAYLQGVRDAMSKQSAGRYGLHSPDSQSAHAKAASSGNGSVSDPSPSGTAEATDPKPEADDTPSTVFIFKDGHQIETRNYAIVGQTLYDFSSSTLKKVPLTNLDTAATAKANDERGTPVKLP
jgi:hypothetical protein